MKLFRACLLPFAFVAVGVVRLLAKFGILIRFGTFWPPRIGHIGMNTECYLCEKDAGLHPKAIDIWSLKAGDPFIPSKYLMKMWRRSMLIDRTRFSNTVMLCNVMFDGHEKHHVEPKQMDRDIHNLLETMPPHLKFTAAEEAKAERILHSWGLPKRAKWVCLIVRDNAYLPHLNYHDYRDADIDNYMQAAYALAHRGYFVFRMGLVTKKDLEIRHSRIFDFARNGMYSDFMSIYLGAKCAFTMSTSTGWDAIPQIFRRPICYTNFVPVEYLPTWQNSLAIWKHHEKDGKRLSIPEICELGAGLFMRADQFEEAGIKVIENTPEEIREAAMEMADIVEGLSYPGSQDEFWRMFPRNVSPYNGQPLHGKHIRLRIGTNFLKERDAERKEDSRDHPGAGGVEASAVQEPDHVQDRRRAG